jgi:hypothetical protein
MFRTLRQTLSESHPESAPDVGEIGPMDDLVAEWLENVIVHPRYRTLPGAALVGSEDDAGLANT